MVIRLPWIQDAISGTEYDAIYWLRALNYRDTDVVTEVITMPFLKSPDPTDALALHAMHRLATKGVLSALVDAALFQNGIADNKYGAGCGGRNALRGRRRSAPSTDAGQRRY